jgi:uncharacterized GH25 family protein
MKSTLVLAFLCMAGSAAFAYQALAPRGSIEGQVVNPDTGAPVRNASVNINFSSGRPIRPGQPVQQYYNTVVDTDEQGHFAVRDLTGGSYQLRAQRRGTQNYSGAGSTVILGENQQVKGVTLKLATQPVIAGKVLDQDGEPMQNAQVTVLRMQNFSGRMQWVSTGNAQTSDLGEYRILVPTSGSYLVAAGFRYFGMTSQSGQLLPDKPEPAYVTTYYPSTLDPSQAKKVLAGGGEVRGIDIKMQKVPTVRIRGRVIDPQPTQNRTASVMLKPIDKPATPYGGIGALMIGMGGDFEIFGVPSGSYTLVAQKYLTDGNSIGSGTPSIAAAMPLEVGDKAIDGITLKLAPSKDLQGTIKLEGSAPSNSASARIAQIYAESADGYGFGPQPRASNIGADHFTLSNVNAGRYVLNVTANTAYYVKSIRYAGKEIPPDGVDLTGGGLIEITVSADGGRLQGAVVDSAGKPVLRGLVTISATNGVTPSRNIMPIDSNGEYHFQMLPPGEYKVLAWDGGIDSASVQNPDLMKAFDAGAKVAKLEAGGTATVSLTATSAAEGATKLPGLVQSQAEQQHTKGSLEGQILNAKTGLPVGGAVVRIGSSMFVRNAGRGGTAGNIVYPVGYMGPTQPQGLITETDDQGHFAFRDVQPALYVLGAERQGFVTGVYARSRNNPDEIVIVGEGQQVQNLVLKLAPQAVVAGKVLDEQGEPVTNAMVTIFRRMYSHGENRFAQGASTVRTNDLGEYRIPSLTAGTYIVGTRYSPPVYLTDGVLPDHADSAYRVTYFPSAASAVEAKAVVVEPGMEIANLDIVLKKAPAFRIRGKMVDPKGPLGRAVVIVLTARDAGPQPMVATAPIARNPEGDFEIFGVSPGAYSLMARVTDAGETRASAQSIEVRDHSVDGVKLELAEARTVKATLTLDDKPATNNNGGYYANLISPDNFGNIGTMQGSFDGTGLTFRNVLPIPYNITMTNLPPNCNCYVKSIVYGGKEIPETGAVLTSGAPLEINLSAKASIVEGTVVNRRGEPVPGAVLAIVPAGGSLAHLKTGTADDRGRFYWPGNSPGEYKLLAWEDVDMASLEMPGILQQFEASAKVMKLEGNGHETIQLTAVPASPQH